MPRFHLSFKYDGQHKTLSVGSQVVICDSLDEAIKIIAKERNLSKIFIDKRFFYDKPVNEAEAINKWFEV